MYDSVIFSTDPIRVVIDEGVTKPMVRINVEIVFKILDEIIECVLYPNENTITRISIEVDEIIKFSTNLVDKIDTTLNITIEEAYSTIVVAKEAVHFMETQDNNEFCVADLNTIKPMIAFISISPIVQSVGVHTKEDKFIIFLEVMSVRATSAKWKSTVESYEKGMVPIKEY
jgi:hypothetical protein